MTENPDTLDPITAEKHKLCLMLYGIFAVSLLMQVNPWTAVVGSAAVIAGIIIAYTERKKAFGSVYGNHLQWLIRTFWIGGAVYLPIVTLIGFGGIIYFMDFSPMADAIATGEGTMQTIIPTLLEKNKNLFYIVLGIATLPFALWWWYRCWYGYKRLKAGKPIPNPTSWF